MQQQEKTIEELLNEFEAAIGKNFELTGNMRKYNNKWAGEIIGINRENMMLIGDKGEFPIYVCRIKEKELPTLKEWRQQRQERCQGNLFV